jgi:hypothetical protein
MATLGKLWGDAGLCDLLIDSEMYAAATTAQMLDGKQYKRAVRGFTLAFEAMMEHYICSFIKWCPNEMPRSVLEQLDNAKSAFSNTSATETHPTCAESVSDLEEGLTEHVLPRMREYEEWGCSQSPTFQYWVMFLHAVSILLQNIRAERTGDWAMHLHTVYSMLPYFFTCNRTNYARWTPVYLLSMLDVPDDIKTAFDNGQFAVRQTTGGFNGIWSDLGTEKTIIRDAKGESGIIGLTRKKPALVRWTLTRHLLCTYARAMRDRSGLKTKDASLTVHDQLNSSAMTRDEKNAQTLVDHIADSMTNPFTVDDHPEQTLINIATGLHASAEVQKSLLSAVDTGQGQFTKFVQGSLSLTSQKSLYDAIPRSSLLTFSDMSKKTKLTCKGKTIHVTMNSELVFRRALAIAKTREMTMDFLLEYPITAIPTSLFHEDGTMRKTRKDDLAHKLEAKIKSQVTLPPGHGPSTVYIRDAMAVIQSLNGDQFKTFDDLAKAYLQGLT